MQYPDEYKYDYIKGCYDVLNGVDSKTLEEAKKINETEKHRMVAMCIENRPDNCTEKDIRQMREFGCTRVEIGVQILDDEIYKKIARGHTVSDVVDATKRLKDAGFKLGYHIMPGLPYSTPEKDFEKFKEVFEDSRFRPDQLKLYPCQIVEDSPLENMYKRINYEPYSNETIKELMIKMFKVIPDYCRVMRVMREIPAEKMKGNVASTSMRSVVQKELENSGIKEIRMREIGFQKGEVDFKTKLKTIEYEASEGDEYFLEVVNEEDVLFGLLRLRIIEDGNSNPSEPLPDHPPQKINKKFVENSKKDGDGKIAIVRELHVYGKALNLGERGEKSQHIGLGKKLMKEAEIISRENDCKKIKVISGVGVREYYRNLGYKLEDDYMVKDLD